MEFSCRSAVCYIFWGIFPQTLGVAALEMVYVPTVQRCLGGQKRRGWGSGGEGRGVGREGEWGGARSNCWRFLALMQITDSTMPRTWSTQVMTGSICNDSPLTSRCRSGHIWQAKLSLEEHSTHGTLSAYTLYLRPFTAAFHDYNLAPGIYKCDLHTEPTYRAREVL